MCAIDYSHTEIHIRKLLVVPAIVMPSSVLSVRPRVSILCVSLPWLKFSKCRLYFLLCLQWFAKHQDGIQKWVKRLRCLCSFCACLGLASALEPLRKMDLDEDENSEESQRFGPLLVQYFL